MLPNQVNDWRMGSPRIVKVSQSIREPWAQVKKRAGRFTSHARVAICRGSNDALK